MTSDAIRAARRARWLLGLGMATALVAAWSSWSEIQLVQSIARGAEVSDAAIEANDSRQALLGIVQLLIGIVVAIGFLMWTRGLTKRLIELGVADMRYAPKWSVWGFLVPILNLFRPHQVMAELWKASDIDPGPDDPWRARATPLIVHLWWTALIVEGVVGRMLVSSSRQLDTIDDVLRASTITFAADLLGVLSAGLAFQLVTIVDARLRAGELRREGAALAPSALPTA